MGFIPEKHCDRLQVTGLAGLGTLCTVQNLNIHIHDILFD